MNKISCLLILIIVLLGSCQPKAQDEIKFIASDEFKKSNLPFSEAVVVGNLMYLSGQVGSSPDDPMTLVEGGMKNEARQALENIKIVLENNGASMSDVVKCSVMLADISEWADFNSVYVQYFPNDKLARSAFGTSGLALGARVEIDCIAVLRN